MSDSYVAWIVERRDQVLSPHPGVVAFPGDGIELRFVMPAKAGIQAPDSARLFASLTLRADFQSFNALRAFVRLSPE